MALINSKVFENDFGVGIHTGTGKYCLFFSESYGVVDYLEYYEISKDDYEMFMAGKDLDRLRLLVENSRKNLNSDKKIHPLKPSPAK
jgi:hypothetical protein